MSEPLSSVCRRIALIAHDKKKRDMTEWAGYNLHRLRQHHCSRRTADFLISSPMMAEVHQPASPLAARAVPRQAGAA